MKKKGVGIASAWYPTGMSGGGDSSQALVRLKPDGSADLYIGSCDIGQGIKTIAAQTCAEILGIQYEQVKVANNDTDACPMCFGTFASRVTFFCCNAVIQAAEEARDILFQVAGPSLNADPTDLIIGNGKISVKDDPSRSIGIGDVAGMAMFAKATQVVGRGHFMRAPSSPDPDTGKCNPAAAIAWAAVMAEVEVDTDTGVVDVLKLTCAYDVGKAMNPMLAEGQIEGGAAMGLGGALMENLMPFYPLQSEQPETLGDYIIPTAVDIPAIESVILECPSLDGPFGAKGIGEMTANSPSPAIVNAIHDAVGIWISSLPVTPEKVLRALDEKSAA